MSELLWQSVKDGANSADYILYDEFQNVALGKGSTLGAMLREGRKYGLGVWLATQILSINEPEQIDYVTAGRYNVAVSSFRAKYEGDCTACRL